MTDSENQSSSAPLPEKSVTGNTASQWDALAQRLLERTSRQLALAIGRSISLVAQDLDSAAKSTDNVLLRRKLFSAAASLGIEQTSRAARVAEALGKVRAFGSVEPAREHLVSAHDRELYGAALEISKKVIEDIDVLEAHTGVNYPAYSARSGLVFGKAADNDAENPIGALMLAHAACNVFRGLTDDSDSDEQLRHALFHRLTPAIVDVVSQAHHELNKEQVLPNWQPRSEIATKPEPSAVPDTAGSQKMVAMSRQAARAGQRLGSADLASLANPAEVLSVLPTLQPVVDIERDAVAFAHSMNVAPYSRESRRYYFGNARKRLAESGLVKGQLAAVDVVSALFDYVVDDKRLPESAKPLFWRLQQPSLALALLDSAYLADEPRSLRRLIENFGAIVTAFPDDVGRGSELFRRLETVTRAVEIVASSLQTRSAVLAKIVDGEFGKASSSITQLIDRVVRERVALEQTPDRRNRRDFGRRPTRAQEVQATEKLQALIDERIGKYDVPDSAREFINQVWMRHLRTAILRDGEGSQQYKLSLQVIDDLLWSLDKTRRSKTKLANKIPPLIRLLTQGMRDIGAKDDEYKPFFDELFLIHLRKMQSKRQSPLAPSDADALSADSGIEATVKLPPELLAQVGLQPSDLTSGRPAKAASLSVDPPPVPTLRETLALPEPVLPPVAKNVELAIPVVLAPVVITPELVAQKLIPEPAPLANGVLAAEPPMQDNSEQKRLLDVLNQLDLSDQRDDLQRIDLLPEQIINRMQVGSWLEMHNREGAKHFAKIAWINHRRSVVLLVRKPDRKAQSLRVTDIQTRLEQKRLFLLG